MPPSSAVSKQTMKWVSNPAKRADTPGVVISHCCICNSRNTIMKKLTGKSCDVISHCCICNSRNNYEEANW